MPKIPSPHVLNTARKVHLLVGLSRTARLLSKRRDFYQRIRRCHDFHDFVTSNLDFLPTGTLWALSNFPTLKTGKCAVEGVQAERRASARAIPGLPTDSNTSQ
ncbi:hypothetical protein Zmor_003475 [Zophobas morio]|uniref:Uncharacterized protein n=1 Tax=Zophobas morio TaxID=2755281 RepID=A0AA38HMN1_9CUCU|nr:hypothetical protein Zmor_003475 [Zophobas morio]